MGEYALRFPYCKQDEKPCDLYISEEEARLKYAQEFVEKIKAHQYQSSDWSHGEHPYIVEVSDIDNILWDMESEINDE